MKFSEKWLRTWVDLDIDSNTLVEDLSLAGLEVDGVEKADNFTQVFVAEILEASKHPEADKLQVCKVSDGTEEFNVVCGAPNARAGLKTAFAKVGAKLGEDIKIKKAKLRGVESCGMLCSEAELGISQESAGIIELPQDAPLGLDLAEYFDIKDDFIIDVDLTPNRADCLSIRGLAREAGAIHSVDFKDIEIEEIEAQISDKFPIEVEAKALSANPLFLGRVIKGVDIQAKTPLKIQQRLAASGIRSIDPIVDITNYVMIELGQPMHAYDLASLEDKVLIRYAKAGEKLTLLDGKELQLSDDDLVICDAKKPLALAGIMGGEFSGCDTSTQDVLLEVAFFDPLHLAGKARKYGLHTDASHRFERGVDYGFAQKAMQRATGLILEICGGKAGEVVSVKSEQNLPKRENIKLRKSRIEKILAFSFADADVVRILETLSLKVAVLEQSPTDTIWSVEVPTFRFDLSLEIDLIEEIARIYGYDNLPIKAPVAQMQMIGGDDSKLDKTRVFYNLAAQGFQESISFTFIDEELAEYFAPDDAQPIVLENPISADLAFMRPSLLPSLLKVILYNQNRQHKEMKFFEEGLKFVKKVNGALEQTSSLALAIAGVNLNSSWREKGRSVDFFDLKQVLENLFALGNNSSEYRFEAMEHKSLHPGQTAAIFKADKQIGWIGKLHPSLAKKLGIKLDVILAEIEFDEFLQGKKIAYKSVSKMPEVKRDFAFILDKDISADYVKQAIYEISDDLLQSMNIFDLYAGEEIGAGKKSLAFSLSWQSNTETLSEEVINSMHTKIISHLQDKHGFVLRS